jgi:hypothetical protein
VDYCPQSGDELWITGPNLWANEAVPVGKDFSSTARPQKSLGHPLFAHRAVPRLSWENKGFPQFPQALLLRPNCLPRGEKIPPTVDRATEGPVLGPNQNEARDQPGPGLAFLSAGRGLLIHRCQSAGTSHRLNEIDQPSAVRGPEDPIRHPQASVVDLGRRLDRRYRCRGVGSEANRS